MNPILIFKTIGISVGLGSGITGSIFSSFQAFTRISIKDFFGTKWFDYTNNEDWKLLKRDLDNSQNQNEKILKETKLENAKKPKDGSKETQNENGEKLKSWCEKIKSIKVKKFLSSNYETILLSYIKDFCIISIGKKLKESNQFTSWETDKTTLKANSGKLDSHSNETNGDLSKEKELNDIKEKKGEDEKEKALFSWCQKTYKKTYKNEDDNLWKLANYYCNKTKPES